MEQQRDTFRAGVGIVIERADGRVLALERADVAGAWQLPQGGIETGEDPTAAAWRELREETGLADADVALVDASDAWFGYELPPSLRSAKTGRGQVHRWFRFRLRDGVSLPALPAGGEFTAARWVTLDELIETTVAFRRPGYRLLQQWLAE